MGISNTKLQAAIDEWVQNERDRFILKRKMIDGKGYEFIAEEADVSAKTVQNVVHKWRPIILDNI